MCIYTMPDMRDYIDVGSHRTYLCACIFIQYDICALTVPTSQYLRAPVEGADVDFGTNAMQLEVKQMALEV